MTESSGDALRENDIRPGSLMPALARVGAADLQRLLTFKDRFVRVSCPACDSKDSRSAFTKNELTYVVCSDCGTMYIDPRPTPEILKAHYAASESYAYWNQHIFPASEEARREKIFRPRAERIADICRRYNIMHGTLLEVGAGFGTFCQEIQRLGVFGRVIAVEPTPDLAETCRRRGLEVIESTIEDMHLAEDSVDVIASFEVIEHLFSPRDFVVKCGSLLPVGGLLVVTSPSVRGFDVTVLQALTGTVSAGHLNYFHPDSLSGLLSECGFETLEISTPGKLDAELVRKKAIAGEFDISQQPFLKQVLIDDWERVGDSFQRFLAENLLSSHMWFVGRKRGSV